MGFGDRSFMQEENWDQCRWVGMDVVDLKGLFLCYMVLLTS